MVTASTYQKEHFFAGNERLTLLQDALLRYADEQEWKLQAWAVFPNHYHFVALAPEDANLKKLIKCIHGFTGNSVNRLDGAKGRMVWYRYRDKSLTFRKSYLARLSYVHRNAVHHGLVKEPEAYPYCSAGWFKREADRAFYETVISFPIDQIDEEDE